MAASCAASSTAADPTRPSPPAFTRDSLALILSSKALAIVSVFGPNALLARDTIRAGATISKAPGIIPRPAAVLISSSVAPAAAARCPASPAPAATPSPAPATTPGTPNGAARRKGAVEPTPRTTSRYVPSYAASGAKNSCTPPPISAIRRRAACSCSSGNRKDAPVSPASTVPAAPAPSALNVSGTYPNNEASSGAGSGGVPRLSRVISAARIAAARVSPALSALTSASPSCRIVGI